MSAYHFTPVYGNGWQAVLSIIERLWAVLKKTVSPLMEMASKQFSSFMELRSQLCLTLCATVSYALCNSVLRLMEMVSKQFSHLWNCLCNCVLRFVQLCLTFYGNG